jgi:membrane-bound lytic murein transglycosylase B
MAVSIGDMVTQTAQRLGVDPTLALEVAIQESGLNPSARSSAGAIGVMQLMPQTAAALGVDPTDAQQNITGGITYLKQQLARFGSVAMALAAYNWGPENVAKAMASYGANWASHLPAETSNYITTILSKAGSASQVVFSPVAAAGTLLKQAASNLPNDDWKKIALLAGGAVAIYLLADTIE